MMLGRSPGQALEHMAGNSQEKQGRKSACDELAAVPFSHGASHISPRSVSITACSTHLVQQQESVVLWHVRNTLELALWLPRTNQLVLGVPAKGWDGCGGCLGRQRCERWARGAADPEQPACSSNVPDAGRQGAAGGRLSNSPELEAAVQVADAHGAAQVWGGGT